MIENQNPVVREAVGIFNDATNLQHALDALEEQGFMRQEISIFANDIAPVSTDPEMPRHADAVKDDPSSPRQVFIPVEIMGEVEGSIIGAPMYVGAVAGAIAAAAAGYTVAVVLASAAVIGLAGGAIGYFVARSVRNKYDRALEAQMQRGGIVLWVAVRAAGMQEVALEVLRKYSARDVHMHDVPLNGSAKIH
ncbi:MAG: hypothetical protein K0R10_576 [Alphaproteobacteria bacterium]|jgi:hypothetical protein|nr:hypothetical protein [Alphaproteobacteria bacterium]